MYEAYSSKGGKSAADPRVLFMALVHRYLYGIYSSRKLEDACQHHIDFRWPLEDLYYRNITPYDRQIRSGTSLMKAMDQSQECEEKLTELLEDDAHNLLLRLINAENEIQQHTGSGEFHLGLPSGSAADPGNAG